MINLKKAIGIIEKGHSPYKVIGVAETQDKYILALDNDDESYYTVNKNNGEESFIWIWDFIELIKSGKAKKINMDLSKAS